MKYLKYLRYIIVHKWYVFIECWKFGIPWRGLLHDMSKFRPKEFFPYANFFYSPQLRRDPTGYYKPTDTGNAAFDLAWLLHQKINPHHWQWWILPEDNGGMKVLEMPRQYILEMVADWTGAGRVQGTSGPLPWYRANKNKMLLHIKTRDAIECILGYPEKVGE